MAQLGTDDQCVFCVVVLWLVRDRCRWAQFWREPGSGFVVLPLDSDNATRDWHSHGRRNPQRYHQLGQQAVESGVAK